MPWDCAGQLGFGRTRARFGLVGADCERTPGSGDWEPVYATADGIYHPPPPAPLAPPPAPDPMRLRFLTPLRIKRDGRFLGARELTAADLIQTLYRRLRTLARLQGAIPTASTCTGPRVRARDCACNPKGSSGTSGRVTPRGRTP